MWMLLFRVYSTSWFYRVLNRSDFKNCLWVYAYVRRAINDCSVSDTSIALSSATRHTEDYHRKRNLNEFSHITARFDQEYVDWKEHVFWLSCTYRLEVNCLFSVTACCVLLKCKSRAENRSTFLHASQSGPGVPYSPLRSFNKRISWDGYRCFCWASSSCKQAYLPHMAVPAGYCNKHIIQTFVSVN